MAAAEEPILFLWSFSPWASKVVAYLALRGIPHSRCEQPITQPRPNLAALGVKYRRIPVLSIGRDVYCDTLLILEKLEQIYPSKDGKYKSISANTPTEIALEKLFEKWTDLVVFKPAAAAIPTDLDLMKDPEFQKDREELWGRPWTKQEQEKLRPAALANLRANFDFLEQCLGDGRQWILGDEGPKLVDIHGKHGSDWHSDRGKATDNVRLQRAGYSTGCCSYPVRSLTSSSASRVIRTRWLGEIGTVPQLLRPRSLRPHLRSCMDLTPCRRSWGRVSKATSSRLRQIQAD
jgi:glutathione S-transferase